MKANEIVKSLCENGHEAYITGGAVRDMILGENPKDIDVITDARPEAIKYIFKNKKVNLVGETFNVCIVDGIEVATYRTDRYFGLSNKNCEISFAKTLEEDLSRRDLTINSLACCPYSGDLIDPYNGVKDLKKRIIKFTGNPHDRIMEDPCRILRACRFLAKIKGSFDKDTFIAIKDIGPKIVKYIAPERIRIEILKAMEYNYPSIFFNSLHDTGLLKLLIPELEECYGFTGGKFHGETIGLHSMIVGDSLSKKDPILRLAGYLHDIGKPLSYSINNNGTFLNHNRIGANITNILLQRLKFSNNEIKRITNAIKFHTRPIHDDITNKAIRRLLYKFKEYEFDYKDFVRLKIADKIGNLASENYSLSNIKNFITKINEVTNPKNNTVFGIKDLKIDGNFVMKKLNIKPGERVGVILKELLNIVLDNPEFNTKEKLEELITTVK